MNPFARIWCVFCFGAGMLALSTLCSGKPTPKKEAELTTIRITFESLEKEWLKECDDSGAYFSSNMYVVRDQPAFRRLVQLGPQIAPLVVERMRTNRTLPETVPTTMQYRPEWLPWTWVLEEITNHHLHKDSRYRELVRQHYRNTDSERLAKIVDPSCISYIEEIAVPYMLEWWEETGKSKVDSSEKGKTKGRFHNSTTIDRRSYYLKVSNILLPKNSVAST